MKIFAENLKNALQNIDLSIEELAKTSSLPLSDLRSFLKAEKCIRPSEITLISKILDISVYRLVSENTVLIKNFSCKMLALDIDGVMTDGGMYVSSDGKEMKKFNTKDGMGIKRAIKNGIVCGIISSGKNIDLVRYRAEMLGIDRIFVGTGEKLPVLQEWCKELNISMDNVAYIGDDINDLEILKAVGLAVCPADAVPEIKEVCSLVLKTKGGQACVRELVENLGINMNKK